MQQSYANYLNQKSLTYIRGNCCNPPSANTCNCPTGARGAIGDTGEQGDTGDTGPNSSVLDLKQGTSRYVVDSQGRIQTGYTTITAAIAAAAATSPTPALQETIWIWPGTYPESLTLTGNINLAAAAPNTVFIVGSSIYTPTNDGDTFTAKHIDFVTDVLGGGAPAFTVNGTATATALFVECTFTGSFGDCFAAANSGSGSTTTHIDCISTAASTFQIYDIQSSHILRTTGALNTATNTASTIANTAQIVAQNVRSVADCFILTDSARFTCTDSFMTNFATTPLLTVAASATASVYNSTLNSAGSTYWATGSGTLQYGTLNFVAATSVTLVDPTLTSVVADIFASGTISFDKGVSVLNPPTLTANQVVLGNANSSLSSVPVGVSGEILTSQGAAVPIWQVFVGVPPGVNYSDYLFWNTYTAPAAFAVGSDTFHLGANAGQSAQITFGVALGYQAGRSGQAASAIALGANAGGFLQSAAAVAVGVSSGGTEQGAGAVAVGSTAGGTGQGAQSVAVGLLAAQFAQSSQSVAVGSAAGNFQQLSTSIAVGNLAGSTNHGVSAVAVGASAGAIFQGSGSVAIGTNAGRNTQGASCVAIGTNAGATSHQLNAVSVGEASGVFFQGTNAVAVGASSGNTLQGVSCVALGQLAGFDTQASNAIAIGLAAGTSGQAFAAIAIGNNSGQTAQRSEAIAIGSAAGQAGQAQGCVAVGTSSGNVGSNSYSVSIGQASGQTLQGMGCVAIGNTTGSSNQRAQAIAIGHRTGVTSQASSCIAIGNSVGIGDQRLQAIAIGLGVTNVGQGANCISVGVTAASNGQQPNAIAIGRSPGQNTQGANGIAIGQQAAVFSQQSGGIAIGAFAAVGTQGVNAIALGSAATTGQGANSIAMGATAGNTALGADSIVLGRGAGMTSTAANAIVLNATGTAYSAATTGFFVKQLRSTADAAAPNLLSIDPGTNEITYSTAKTFVIPHPTPAKTSTHYLVHSCVESSRSDVYYRGVSCVASAVNWADVTVPQYVTDLAGDFTVHLTEIGAGGDTLNVDAPPSLWWDGVVNSATNSFRVYGERGTRFAWMLYGSRRDRGSRIEVEPLRESVNVRGIGAYSWAATVTEPMYIT